MRAIGGGTWESNPPTTTLAAVRLVLKTRPVTRRGVPPATEVYHSILAFPLARYHPPRYTHRHLGMKIIANPRAGHKRGARAIREFRLLLGAKGIKHEFFETQYPGHATELAQRFAEKGDPRIIIFGGDGTISEVVNATVNTEVELGIVSVGTGNDLARSFDLPYNKPHEALEVALTGVPTKVDVGWEQDRYFISTLGLGFPAVIAQEANKMKYLKGPPAFFIATYKAINHLRAIPV